jgi:hypothetical protein
MTQMKSSTAKRSSLLRRHNTLTTEAFRNHWAGAHASIATGMKGIAAYTQNRVDAKLWSGPAAEGYECDGIVELEFENEAVMLAAGETDIVKRQLPEDELKFLEAITLCRVEDGAPQIRPGLVKVMIAARLMDESETAIARFQQIIRSSGCIDCSVDPVESAAHRAALAFESAPPSLFATLWFAGQSDVARAFDSGDWIESVARVVTQASAWQIDPLKVVG